MIESRNLYACAFCQNSFSVAIGLVSHVQIEHKTITTEVRKENNESKAANPEVGKKEKLSDFHDTFKNEKLLRYQSLTKEENITENSIESSNNTQVKLEDECKNIIVDQINQNSGTANNDCEFDGKDDLLHSTVDKDVLKQQITVPQKKFSCEICGKKYTLRDSLRYHERSHNEKTYSCNFCQKMFHYKQRLQIHERIHTGEKPYACRFCNKKIRHYNGKKLHERTHIGEKTYSCSFCNKKFVHISSKKNHEKIHKEERSYSCTFCEKKFRQYLTKKVHERVHTGEKPYSCSYCGEKFKQSCHKLRHEKTHKGEKPYSCSYCDMKFQQIYNLKIHKRFHTGEKPYACSYCELKFVQSHHKIRHEKKYHSIISNDASMNSIL